MSDQTERSQSDTDVTEEQKPSPEESTGDAQAGTTSDDIKSGDAEVPQPPAEGSPS
jgi:hypothetical protein